MNGLIKRAYDFAEKAHEGQVRRYTGEPYISHPQLVYALVKEFGGTDVDCAVALLHDTIEDTAVTFDNIEAEFSLTIAYMVEALSITEGEDAFEKIIQASNPSDLVRIKVCDIIANCVNIWKVDEEYALRYCKKKMDFIVKTRNQTQDQLHSMAMSVLTNWTTKLMTKGSLVRHNKNGTIYRITEIPDERKLEYCGESFYTYQSITTEDVWLRRKSEMEDGRFSTLLY